MIGTRNPPLGGFELHSKSTRVLSERDPKRGVAR
jgi:hypothetical protein